VQRAEFARAMLAVPPGGTPDRFAYGNAGYLVVGAAIEAATGRAWEDVVASDLFAPLRLSSAGFGAPAGDNPWGHAEGPAGLVPLDPAALADNPAILGPAGRVHLALGDYARFLSLFLKGGAPLLKPSTIVTLLTPPAGSRYAGGWSLGEETAAGATLAHEGSNTFWHAIAVIAPARDVAYAAVVNQGGAQGREAALALLAQVRASAAERPSASGG
jgi:CubicO group peptidase (beta-lactamase class C family)